jgi:hypothetical protein
MQGHAKTLNDSRQSFELLITDIAIGKGNASSDLYKCTLGTKYIGIDALIVPNLDFQTRVIKIQNGEAMTMTAVEIAACTKLLKPATGAGAIGQERVDDDLSYGERVEQMKKQKMTPVGYINCYCILGSVAAVERLWSIADNILTDNRKSTGPVLFQTIIYLCSNKRFWDVHLV